MNEQELFTAAVERDRAGRAALLDEACGTDPELRQRLENLLKCHENGADFFDKPAAEILATAEATTIAEGPGTQIGPYKLLQQIGEGGFGVVYMAEQTEPVRRKVALKVIKPGMDTRQVIARFEAERQALAVMDHPHIAKVLDAGTTDSGRPYFVMELVRGIPVTHYCDENQLPIRERLALFANVCLAIQHAHTKGIIHRDIKPTNVLITQQDSQPVVKVIDFGIAKAMGQQLTDKTLFTDFAQMIGTPLYMSPEQAELSSADVDTRSDIYSLGVLLYELLTGTTPVRKDQLKKASFDEIRRMIREDEAQRPSARICGSETLPAIAARRHVEPSRLGKLVCGELDWIVMKALDKDRSRRYESASNFAADVQRYLADEPVLACPPSAAYRCRKFARRYRAALAAAATMAAAVLLAVGSLATAVVVLADSNAEVTAKQKQTNDALDREKRTNEALKSSLDREQQVMYFHRIALAEREIEARRIGRAEELLAECPSHLRGWEWHYLKRRCRQEPVSFREAGSVRCVAVSPNGQLIATTRRGSGEIRIWDRATAKELLPLAGQGGSSSIVFHPDCKWLISAGSDDILRIWDIETGRELRKLHVPEGAVALAVSPDGRLLVTGGRDNTLRVRDAADLRELRTLRGHTRMVYEAAFGPDGLLATGSFDGTVRIWNATTGAAVHRLHGHAGPVLGVAFRRDGKQAASCGVDGTTRVWDAATGKMLLLIRAENVTTIGVAFSPDGRRLATGSWEKVVRVWDLVTDQEALTLRGHTEMVMGVCFTTDGDQLVSFSLDGTVRVWDGTPLGSAAAPGERTLRGHTGAVLDISVAAPSDSPAKSILASASRDGTVRLWNPATAETIHTLGTDFGPMGYVSFSRDGRRLVSADYSGTIRVWDAATGRPIRTFQGTVTRAALSPDGRRVAFTTEVAMVEVRDVDTGEEVLAPFFAHHGPVMSLAFSPDGTKLATGGWDQTAVIWDAVTGRRLHTLSSHGHSVGQAEFSHDGSQLVTASWDKTPMLWDVASGRLLRSFAGHEDTVTDAALSPDGRWLASSSLDNTIRVWDAKSGETVAVLRGHGGYILSVAFSPDGKWLASSSGYRGKGEVKIWDASLWEKETDSE
jgi:WD40 repeat protein/serine/threonine protein kinase